MADRYSAEGIESALREMAAERGTATVSVGWWNEHRDPARHPTSARVIQRYGTWNAACRAAGLTVAETARRGVAPRWNDEACLRWVRAFLDDEGSASSYAAFEGWLKTHDDAPSAQTVRNRLGTWASAQERARA